MKAILPAVFWSAKRLAGVGQAQPPTIGVSVGRPDLGQG